MSDLVSQERATARADRIRIGIRAFVETLNDIAAAYRERDWETLGYEDWDQYVSEEFSETRLKLSVDERRKAVEQLRLSGAMSTRAIGAALGISEATVRRDLAGASDDAARDQQVTGTDGRSYAGTKPRDYNENPLMPDEPEYVRAVAEILELTREYRDWLDEKMRKYFIRWEDIPQFCDDTGNEEHEVRESWKRVHPEEYEQLALEEGAQK